MAKKIVDEQIKLSIVIDGNEAQKKINELEKATIEASREIKNLELQQKQLRKASKENSDEYKQLTARIKELKATISTNTAEVEKQISALKISELTIGQLNTKAQLLKSTLKHLVPGTTDYIRYQNDLKAVTNRMNELNAKGKATSITFGSVADGFNRYAAIGTSILAGATGVVLSLQQIIDYNGKLSDSQADVMKTTGMTKKEVDELTKSFGLFKTRTSRADLLGIAEVGGRIGIAKEEIAEFVQVMNKASVALGDSFEGGPEEVADKLGKIKGLYEEFNDASITSSFESIGSALNDLGADGIASERNVADFVTRVGTLPAALKPSIATALGLGAAFEESGLKAEIAGTNYGKVISIASRDFEAFAQVMKRPADEVQRLLNTNPNEFFLQFADSLKNLNATDLSSVLDFLKLNDNEVKMVLGAAGKNVDLFRDKIELANVSMISATSLTNEYNVKNNNLAATLERIKKTITGWFSSDTFVLWLTTAFEWIGRFIGANEDADGKMQQFRNQLLTFIKVLAIITVSWMSYNTAVKLTTVSIKDFTIAQKILDAITTKSSVIKTFLHSLILRLRLGYYALTGKTYLAAKAQVALNAAQAANPLALLLSLVVGLGVALFAFAKKTNEATDAQVKLNAQQEIAKQYQSELGQSVTSLKSKIDPLISILKDESASLAVRKKAYETLIGINPAFLNTVDTEYRATNKLNEAYSTLITKLEEVALAKARQAVREKKAQAVADAEAAEFEAKLRADKEAKENKERKARNEKRAKEFLDYEKTSTRENTALKGYKTEDISTVETETYKNAKKQSEVARQNFNDFSNYQKTEINRLQKEIKTLKEGSEEYNKKMNELGSWLGESSDKVTKVESGGIDLGGSSSSKGSSRKTDAEREAEREVERLKREHEQRLTEIQKYYDASLKLARAYEDGQFDLMADGYDKEKQILETNHNRKIQDLKAQLVSEDDIKKANSEAELLFTKANNEKLTSEQRKTFEEQGNSYKTLANAWFKNNEEIYRKVEQETDLHCLKLATVVEKYANNEVSKIEENYEREKIIRQTQLNEELIALGTNETEKQKLRDEAAKVEIQKEIEKVEKILKLYQDMISGTNVEGLDFTLLPDSALKEFEEKILKAKELLSGLKVNKAENDNQSSISGDSKINLGAKTDILGFSEEDWKQLYDNLKKGEFGINSWTAALMAVGEAWNTFAPMVDDLMRAQEERQLRRHDEVARKKENRLKQQLDNSLISQDQYNKAVEDIERDLERKKYEIELKQAKRKKKMDIVSVIMNTATGIMKGFADLGPIGGTVSAIMIGAMGALQAATIAKQPLPAPGYEKGLYGNHLVKRSQDGKIFNSTFGGKTKSGVVNKPTHFLTGENGPEMIIDSKAFRQMNPDLRNSLIRELRGIKGFENGYYNQDTMSYNVANSGNVPNGEFMVVLFEIRNLLQKIDREGIQATVSNGDLPSMKNIKKGIQNFDNFRNRNKVK